METPQAFGSVVGMLKRGRKVDGGRSRRGLGMNCDWSSASLESGVEGIDVGQNDQHQYDEDGTGQ